MKVGVVTDDKKTISPHFGRAQYYLVYEIRDGVILNKEMRPKSSHHHRETIELHRTEEEEIVLDRHQDTHSEASLHDSMLSNVRDCEALIAGGMGYGMFVAIKQLGIIPFITNIVIADDAIQAYVKGTLDNHIERLH